MKKIAILFFIILFIGVNLKAQSTIEKIIGALSEYSNPSSFKNVINKTVEVNSTSKIGGVTRQIIKVSLPAGTTKWFYRATIMPVKVDYSYQNNETFFYLLQNKKTMQAPSLAPDDNINFLLFDQSANATLFISEKPYTCHTSGSFKNTNSFVAESTYMPENLWIGIENINVVHGLKVIVEVVAYGKYN